MKPLIALTCRLANFDNNQRLFVNQDYFKAITLANGIPVMLGYNDYDDLTSIVDRFDGLLVTGGDDLNPAAFNQEPHPSITLTDPKIDEADYNLIRLFMDKKKPILGICRGLQSLNVALQGSLYQDLPSNYPKMRHGGHNQNEMTPPLGKHDFAHEVYFNAGTKMHEIFGNHYPVNSYHHQNIDQLAEGLTASGVSDDGLIEAVEIGNQVLGIQWHPERLLHDPKHFQLFTTFIDSCQKKNI